MTLGVETGLLGIVPGVQSWVGLVTVVIYAVGVAYRTGTENGRKYKGYEKSGLFLGLEDMQILVMDI